MKIYITTLFISLTLYFSIPLFAEEGVCKVYEIRAHIAEDTMGHVHNKISKIKSALAAARKKMDSAASSIWSFDLNNLPQRQELHRLVQNVEDLKRDLQMEKDDFHRLTGWLKEARSSLAAAGCDVPPERTWDKQPDSPAKPAQPTPPPQALLPNWVGSYRGPCTYEDASINLKQTSDATMEVTQTGPQNLRLSAVGSPQPVDLTVTSDPATAKGTLSTQVGSAASGGGADMSYTAVIKGDVLSLSMSSTNEGHINMNGLQATHKGSSKMSCTMTRVP